VVGGTALALKAAEPLFAAAGARRYLRLAVNCPFHTPLLAGAAERFLPFLNSVTFNNPAVPVFSNVSGAMLATGIEAKENALLQITSPVRWFKELCAIAAASPEISFNQLLEVGPGKVLQGLWKDSGSAIVCHAAGTVADIQALLE
jgi:[acyl-carrier-protein] S-malonyltransferase